MLQLKPAQTALSAADFLRQFIGKDNKNKHTVHDPLIDLYGWKKAALLSYILFLSDKGTDRVWFWKTAKCFAREKHLTVNEVDKYITFFKKKGLLTTAKRPIANTRQVRHINVNREAIRQLLEPKYDPTPPPINGLQNQTKLTVVPTHKKDEKVTAMEPTKQLEPMPAIAPIPAPEPLKIPPKQSAVGMGAISLEDGHKDFDLKTINNKNIKEKVIQNEIPPIDTINPQDYEPSAVALDQIAKLCNHQQSTSYPDIKLAHFKVNMTKKNHPPATQAQFDQEFPVFVERGWNWGDCEKPNYRAVNPDKPKKSSTMDILTDRSWAEGIVTDLISTRDFNSEIYTKI